MAEPCLFQPSNGYIWRITANLYLSLLFIFVSIVVVLGLNSGLQTFKASVLMLIYTHRPSLFYGTVSLISRFLSHLYQSYAYVCQLFSQLRSGQILLWWLKMGIQVSVETNKESVLFWLNNCELLPHSWSTFSFNNSDDEFL